MAPGARSKFGAPIFEPEVFRKQMYCTEQSILMTLLAFRCPRSHSAPMELFPLCPPRYAPAFDWQSYNTVACSGVARPKIRDGPNILILANNRICFWVPRHARRQDMLEILGSVAPLPPPGYGCDSVSIVICSIIILSERKLYNLI